MAQISTITIARTFPGQVARETGRKQRLMKRIVATLLLLCLSRGIASANVREPVYRFSAAQKSVFYYRLAELIQREIRRADPGFDIELMSSNGSLKNVQRLLSRGGEPPEADIAWVQSDVLTYAYQNKSFRRNHAYFSGYSNHRSLRAVISFATELLYIVVRHPFHIDSLRDLMPKTRVAMGAPNSGTMASVHIILDSVGARVMNLAATADSTCHPSSEVVSSAVKPTGTSITGNHIYQSVGTNIASLLAGWAHDLGFSQDFRYPCTTVEYGDTLSQRLLAKDYDVAFLVSLPENRNIHNVLQAQAGTLLSLPTTRCSWIVNRLPCFTRASIPPGTFPGQRNEVLTLGIRTILATTDRLPAAHVEALLAAMMRLHNRGHFDDISGLRFEPYRYRESVTIPFHVGAQRYFHEHRLDFVDWAFVWNTALVIIVGLCLLAFLCFNFTRVRLAWDRHRIYVLIGAAAVLMFAAASVVFFLERTQNENFSSIPETLWSITVYLSSGFEDRAPVTPSGRLTSILIMVCGPVIFAIFTAYVAAHWIHSLLEEQRVPSVLAGHYVICNWNDRAFGLIRDLTATRGRKGKKPFIVLIPGANGLSEIRGLRKSHPDMMRYVYLQTGDAMDIDTLEKSGLRSAECVIVLADESMGTSSDGRTILLVHAVADLLTRPNGSETRSRIRLVCELLDPIHEAYLRRIQDDLINKTDDALGKDLSRQIPLEIEVLPVGRIQLTPFSQSARTYGISRLYFGLSSSYSSASKIPYPLRQVFPTLGPATVDRSAQVQLTIRPIHPSYIGRPFTDLLKDELLNRLREKHHRPWILPIGLLREPSVSSDQDPVDERTALGPVILTTPSGGHKFIRKGDRLVYLFHRARSDEFRKGLMPDKIRPRTHSDE